MTNSISFPGLGLNFTINRVAFNILGKDVYWYGLIIMMGIMIALLFVTKSAKKRGIKSDIILDVVMWGLVFGIIGARIYYILFDTSFDAKTFWDYFKVWEGGIAIYGGLIAACVTAIIFCRIKKLPVLKIFDICAPGLLIGQLVGRWGNFVNAEVYGKVTSMPWRMSINGGEGVHPLFLYESLWNLLGLVLLSLFNNPRKKDGEVFFFYTLWYGLGRLYLEGMRQSQFVLYVIPGVLGISQLVAGIMIVISVTALVYLRLASKKK